MTVPPTRLTVGGLDMSTLTWNRMVAAVRGLFPQQTAGLSDFGAVQAVLAKVLTEWVANWETTQATEHPSVLGKRVADEAIAVRTAAGAKARADCAADVHPTITT